ncbi:MAG: metallophosphoesterase [Cellvibrionales bacterium]|nr:metallophosphoesterase [Cellvibrionales bacterium]
MKIQYQSDLHVEFFNNTITYQVPATDADVLVLAGDIGDTSQRTFDWIKAQSQNKPILLCLGNHEFYDQCYQEALIQWQAAMKDSSVHLLHNNTVIIENTQFIGATLWTDYAILGALTQEAAMHEAGRRMNDHRLIQWLDKGKKRLFTPKDARALNAETDAFLRETLTKPFDGKRVIITHHAPSIQSIPVEYRSHNLCGAFASNYETLMATHKPSAWIHGHLHMNFAYKIHSTQVVCNPRGYENHELNPNFNPKAVLII